jgi:hypothetical protein
MAKRLQDESKEYTLCNEDMEVIMLYQKAALDSYNFNRQMVARFLAIRAGKNWGYPPDIELDFEIDPKEHRVKVTPAKRS